MTHARRSVVLALAVALLGGVAHAQPRDVGKADALFREGRVLLKRGDYETACPKLEESYRLDPAAGTAINLGDCFERVGKVASALIAYQAARELLRPGDPRIGAVDQEIKALDARVPRLTIELAPGAPEGTEVKRDGRVVEATLFGVQVPVNPGTHVVLVTAPGRALARYQIDMVEGESRKIAAQTSSHRLLPDAGAASTNGVPLHAAKPPVGAAPNDGSQRVAGFVVGGIGVVALSVAGIFALSANSKDKDAEKYCDPPDYSTCSSPGIALTEAAKSDRSTANWSAGLGVLALATGLVLIVTSPSGDAAARLRIAPRVLVGGASAQLGATW